MVQVAHLSFTRELKWLYSYKLLLNANPRFYVVIITIAVSRTPSPVAGLLPIVRARLHDTGSSGEEWNDVSLVRGYHSDAHHSAGSRPAYHNPYQLPVLLCMPLMHSCAGAT